MYNEQDHVSLNTPGTDFTPKPQGADFYDKPVEGYPAQPQAQSYGQPMAQPQAQSYEQPMAQPQAQSYEQPMAQPQAQSYEQPMAQPQAQSYEQPMAQPQAQSYEQPMAQPQAQSYEQPMAQPQAQSYEQPMAQPQAQSYEQSMAQPQAQSYEQPMAQPQVLQYEQTQEEAPPKTRAELRAEKRAEKKARKKKSIPIGFAITMVLVCTVLSLGAGFGGGIWAADQIGQHITADINENIQAYLEENGSTVLYRSVATETEEGEDAMSASSHKDSVVTAVAQLAADSVVEISTEVLTENFYSFFGMGGRSITQGAGSGVILSNDGYILTCYHVIEDATTIGVTLRNGSQYEASLIGGDEELDIAVIKVDAKNLIPAVLGSSNALVVGSPVVAIGNPLGQLGGTVTSGYISALDRAVTIDEHSYNLLQTDAAINGGNSGGGLFNANGELVGLVNAKAQSIGVEGLGFAIPIDDIAQDIEDLINYGYITSRVTLGVTMVDIMDQRTALAYRVDEFGVYILNVSTGSNAEVAGLQAGDRIISIDGTPIESGDQVVEIISTYSVGDVMDMVISRGGEEVQVFITMYGTLPDPTASTPVNSGI